MDFMLASFRPLFDLKRAAHAGGAFLFSIILWMVSLPAWAQADADISESAISGRIAALLFGLLIGVVLAAAAYLFFIWIAMRDRGQIFLLLFLLCVAVHIIGSNDLLAYGVTPLPPFGRLILSDTSMLAAWGAALFFTYHFLELDMNSPQYGPIFMSVGFLLALMFFYAFLDPGTVHLIMPAAATMAISVILIAGISGVHHGTSGSLVHIVAFACFLGGGLTDAAYAVGLIATPEIASRVASLSLALSVLIFAIVIVSQFAGRQEEKEHALAISNERFMLATRGANEGLFDWNIATGEVFFSDQFRKILGMRIENAPDGLKRWARMMVPADRLVVAEALRRFRRNPRTNTLNVEYRIVQPGGERRWMHSKAVAMRDARSNRILRLVGSTSDVTLRKQSEVALRASETRFRSITEAHPVPVLIVRADNGSVLYATPGAEGLLGAQQEEIMQCAISRFFPDSDKRRELENSLKMGQSVDLLETEMIRGDGNPLPVAVSARRITYQNEDAFVLGLYDLTERKKAEAQIARQQEALQQSEKMAALGGLLAGVAHELNNPLSIVVGQATLLMDSAPEAKVATRAEKIFKAADRCSRIVKSFLALARRKPPERKPVDLNQVVRGALELLGYQIRTTDITVQMALDPALPPILGDADQMTQVVTNLVLNATQALQGWKGPRRIAVTTRRDITGSVSLSVADTGAGVPIAIRPRIFEPFFTTKGEQGGTGVGLALCLNIVSAHGGKLWVDDASEGGAVFTIEFPAASFQQTLADDQPDAETSPLPFLHILLVDDELDIAQTLADLLEPDGHRVDIAVNGAIALQKLKKESFDVIISDLRMPVMDGPALYEALQRELPSYAKRVIYVTGDTLSTHVQAFLSSHSVPLVEKPYRIKEIRRALGDLLQRLGTQ